MKNKPDYWYKQSSVIPFRIKNGITEVLIITNVKKSKWIFPKGIIEPGLTSRESALKEALEEAGITGNFWPKRLGKYSYKKWGDKCKVKVYALSVTKTFEVWDEDFRDRKWIDIKTIQEYIKDKRLIELAEELELKIIN